MTEQDGITYVVEQTLVDRLGGIKVDYVENGWQSGFAITAERFTPSSCGSSCSC